MRLPNAALRFKPAPPVDKAAQDKFDAALDAFNGHDKAADWSDATCADVASQFQAAASQQKNGKLPEATFDAGPLGGAWATMMALGASLIRRVNFIEIFANR